MNWKIQVKRKFGSSNFILHNSKGVTLIELLLYMGLLSIFLLVLTQLFLSILDLSSEANQISAVAQNGRYIIARLGYDIKRADSISTPVLGGSASSLTLSIGGSTYAYTLSGVNLGLTVDSAPAENMNSPDSQISSITFTRIGNAGGKHTIQVQFTIRSTAIKASGPEQLSFQTTIGLR